MSWSELIPDIVSLPIKAYKHRYKLQELWKKALTISDLGSTNILILGRANVGKTVFLDCLNGRANDPFYLKPDTSKKADKEAIEVGDWHSLFRTAPGQTIFNRDNTIDKAFENSDKLEGIIYLVDWGYTNYRRNTLIKKMIEQDGIDTIEQLRAFNQKEELDDFKKISEQIKKVFRKGKSISWLLIVVTKADLFYSKKQLDEVEQIYHPLFESEFTNLLNDLSANVGKVRFKIDTIPFSSYPENFEWNKQIVRSNIGQRENQNKLVRNFYSKLLELQKG